MTPEDLERASRALALLPRAENNSRCQLDQRRIQFASVQAIEKAGVDIAVVEERPVVEAVVANGEIVYDETRSAHLASRVAGTVVRVNAQVGDRMQKGEVLALIDAADVGKAKAELLQAIVQLRLKKIDAERLKPLAQSGSVPGRQLREAQSALEEAKIRMLGAQQTLVNLGLPVQAADFADLDTDEIAQRIQFIGLPAEIVAGLDDTSATSNLFPLRSPLDGVVVDCTVVPGEVVDTSVMIFGVADVRQMWLTLDVRQVDAQYLALGQSVLFRSSEQENEPEIKGSIRWISTSADDQTRTVKVRAHLSNSDGRLRANTFGTGRIVLREEPRAIVVPSEAVHWDGCCNVVFVRDKNYFDEGAPKFFHIRKVRLGVKDDDTTRDHRRPVAGRSDCQQEQRRAGSAVAQEQSRSRLRLLCRRSLDASDALRLAGDTAVLNWIIDFSLRHRLLVILIVAVLAVGGGLSLRYLDIDAFPDTTSVQVQVNTVAPVSRPRRGRAADHVSDRTGDRRPARPGKHAVGLEVWLFPGGRDVQRRHRHLLRSATRQRAPGHGGIGRGHRAAQDGTGVDRPR